MGYEGNWNVFHRAFCFATDCGRTWYVSIATPTQLFSHAVPRAYRIGLKTRAVMAVTNSIQIDWNICMMLLLDAAGTRYILMHTYSTQHTLTAHGECDGTWIINTTCVCANLKIFPANERVYSLPLPVSLSIYPSLRFSVRIRNSR